MIKRLTNGSKHHFFGFHDIKASNNSNDKILSLEVDIINRPPLPNEKAGVGYINAEGNYIRLGETNAYNYPQGARMQWIADSDCFVVNNQVGNKWGSSVYDTTTNKLIEDLGDSVHCLSKDGKTAFTLNYARLFRLGVYGYIGLKDTSDDQIAPTDDGIFCHNIETNESSLLLSIHEIANHNPLLVPNKGFHHYVTHLSLNPTNTRIAFLHRYRLQDGGETSRLMSANVDGTDLRCLATGFLSHFDWQDDESLIIFGRYNSSIDTLRNNPLFANPLIGGSLRLVKKGVRLFLKPKAGGQASNEFFMHVTDVEPATIDPFAKGIILADGHPMFNPANRDWLSNDTYPDKDGIRTLMLYNVSSNQRIDLGTFKMINDIPDKTLWEEYTQGVDATIMKLFSLDAYTFTRSGLHCDLHPRWDGVGERIIFDSIHEGTRQMYSVDVKDIINKNNG